MSKCSVYWIFDDTCTDMAKHGYIGVSHLPEKRFLHHKQKSRVPLNSSMKIIFEGSREDCFEYEKQMRPTKFIGWNNAVGGSHGWRIGFNHSDSTKQKMKNAWTDDRKLKASDFRKQANVKLRGQKRPKQSEAMIGENNPMFGTKRPQSVIDAIILSNKNKVPSNKQELYCVFCRQRASIGILKKYHSKCFKSFYSCVKETK